MKTAEQLSRVNDSDIYFAVAILLFAFEKVGFAIFALMIGFFCFICKDFIEKSERK